MVSQPDWSTDAGFRPDPVSPLGFGRFGERPPIPANDQGSSLARTVSADLEEIFAPAPFDAPEPTRSARVRTMGAVAKPAPSPSRIAGLGAVAAALLAGVVLGSILLKPHPKAAPNVAPASAVTVALTPAPNPPIPSAPTPGAADLPAPPPVVAKAPAPKPAAVARLQPKPAVRRAATSRNAVIAADRRLRRAYSDAVRAGVPRGILVAARNRWNATRRAEPARLVAVYGALAADLERRAHRRRR